MSPIDALWHLLNFFSAACATGVLTAVLAKWLWRSELRQVRWGRLISWAVVPATLASLAGLVVTGRDGMMSTYVTMLVACALGIWWAGFWRRG